MRSTDEQRWHWGEGNKFVVEGGKILVLLNGAAAISILTFIGNSHSKIPAIPIAMIIFACGAFFSSLVFPCAYVTQLYYGNDKDSIAGRWHIVSYLVVALSIFSFLIGTIVAALGFLKQA